MTPPIISLPLESTVIFIYKIEWTTAKEALDAPHEQMIGSFNPMNSSNTSLPRVTFPGGPSPDSNYPSYNKPMDTQHTASVSGESAGAGSQAGGKSGNIDGSLKVGSGSDPSGGISSSPSNPASDHPAEILPSALPSQPHQHPALATQGKNGSEGRPDEKLNTTNAPTGVGATGPSPSKDARRSASAASHRNNNANGTAFAIGAATAANEPLDVDPSLQARITSAEDEPRPREMVAIGKEEHGVVRKLSKIIKSESKAESASLHVALEELAEIQKLQKGSIKEEGISQSRHSRALSDAHKAEMELLIARTANEREQAGLRAAGEVLEASRKHARETTEMLREKMEEVERLRVYKQMDDRERAVKVKGLVGEKRKAFSRILKSA
ncbi:hypothetical protein B0F90DRAFT_1916580 [Multifurca ochricompacta]|uniref:Uncharacterized protein n=1 Tax=Multifurca ochricompacta TaxID=376703 RepID=A0AAD4QPU6_9AGAM|nr:hypothetical protein B0F90DRAFT_1916580 [Multifurca ochricompacta]